MKLKILKEDSWTFPIHPTHKIIVNGTSPEVTTKPAGIKLVMSDYRSVHKFHPNSSIKIKMLSDISIYKLD